jgi:hypothetical protein
MISARAATIFLVSGGVSTFWVGSRPYRSANFRRGVNRLLFPGDGVPTLLDPGIQKNPSHAWTSFKVRRSSFKRTKRSLKSMLNHISWICFDG